MKRALEAALVLAVAALGGYVARQVLARRELAAHPPVVNPALMPSADVEEPDASGSSAPPQRAVDSLPMIKLSRPPKPLRRDADVPPPSVAQ